MAQRITIQSFSFRNPLPETALGFVFDCRMLANPAREERLREKTGLDADVRAFFAQHAVELEEFLRPIKTLVGFASKTYSKMGQTEFVVSFGCMGGQHRSVYCAEQLAAWIRTSLHKRVTVRHLQLE